MKAKFLFSPDKSGFKIFSNAIFQVVNTMSQTLRLVLSVRYRCAPFNNSSPRTVRVHYVPLQPRSGAWKLRVRELDVNVLQKALRSAVLSSHFTPNQQNLHQILSLDATWRPRCGPQLIACKNQNDGQRFWNDESIYGVSYCIAMTTWTISCVQIVVLAQIYRKSTCLSGLYPDSRMPNYCDKTNVLYSTGYHFCQESPIVDGYCYFGSRTNILESFMFSGTYNPKSLLLNIKMVPRYTKLSTKASFIVGELLPDCTGLNLHKYTHIIAPSVLQ